MSSKHKFPFLKTLKGRLFVRYSLLFGLLAALTFTLIYRQISQSLNEKSDAQLSKFLMHFELLSYTKKNAELPKWFWEKSSYTLMGNYTKKKDKPPMFAVYAENGALLLESYKLDKSYNFEGLFDRAGGIKKPYFKDVLLYGKIPYRMVLIKMGSTFLMAARSRLGDYEQLKYFRQLFIAAAVLMFLGGLAIAWMTLSQATSGLTRTRSIAEKITIDGDYNKMIPLKNEGAEVDALIVSFNSMLRQTEVLMEELEQVSNNVAHDLRTPITRLKAMAQSVLLNKNESMTFAEFAEKVVEESDVQSGIIETVLTIAGLESNNSILVKNEFNPRVMIEKLYQLYDALAESKGVNLSFSAPEQNMTYNGDQGKLERALANLIDNAMKYTGGGGKVEIILQDKEGLHIDVVDNGVGIEASEQSKVFKRFYRCDSSRSKPGNGLGLSLAHAVIKAHGGSLDLKSDVGEGCCFSINLP